MKCTTTSLRRRDYLTAESAAFQTERLLNAAALWEPQGPYGYPRTPLTRWQWDRDAVRVSLGFLGLRWPVSVIPARHLGAFKAVYSGAPRGPLHRIFVIAGLRSRAYASISLWHELMHARQCELSGAASPAEWWATIEPDYVETPFDAYLAQPIEQEAYASEINHFDVRPLTRPAGAARLRRILIRTQEG